MRYDNSTGKYNVDVIPFPQWRAWFYEDENGRNVIRQWLDELSISGPDRIAFQSLIDICEYSGPDALSYCTRDLGDGFYALVCRHGKASVQLAPIFFRGPFSPTEITFLAGARIDGKKLKPGYAKGIAEENLLALKQEPKRRRRESIT